MIVDYCLECKGKKSGWKEILGVSPNKFCKDCGLQLVERIIE